MSNECTIAPVLSLRLEAAQRLGCTSRNLDPDTGYLWEIRRGDVTCTLYGGLSPLNDAVSASVATDKFHAGNLLSRAGFTVPRSTRCLRPGRFEPSSFHEQTGHRAAKTFARRCGFPLVVKPGHGARGRDVTAVLDDQALTSAIEQVWRDDYLALVQEAVQGIDLRVDMLDGECLIAYVRRPLSVVGDGRQTLEGLLEQAGAAAEAACADPSWAALAAKGVTLACILAVNETVTFRGPVLNLNRLARAEVVALPPSWRAFTQAVGDALGLRHCGVDFKISSLDAAPETATVIEVNASPSMLQIALRGHRDTVMEGEEKIVEAMLEQARLRGSQSA